MTNNAQKCDIKRGKKINAENNQRIGINPIWAAGIFNLLSDSWHANVSKKKWLKDLYIALFDDMKANCSRSYEHFNVQYLDNRLIVCR